MTKRRSFDEVYPTKEIYRRFNQTDSAFGQQLRKTGRMIEFGSGKYRSDRMRKNIPGFSLMDYAFHDAAGMYENLPGETPDRDKGLYSWRPLGAARKPDKVSRWEGSIEEASRVITKAATYFGAVGVGFCELDRRWVYSRSRYGKEIVFEDIEEGLS